MQRWGVQDLARQFVDLPLFVRESGKLVSELQTGIFVQIGGLECRITRLETIPQYIAILKRVDKPLLILTGAFGHDQPAIEIADVRIGPFQLRRIVLLLHVIVVEEGVAFEELAAGDEAVGHRVLFVALAALEVGAERRYATCVVDGVLRRSVLEATVVAELGYACLQ